MGFQSLKTFLTLSLVVSGTLFSQLKASEILNSGQSSFLTIASVSMKQVEVVPSVELLGPAPENYVDKDNAPESDKKDPSVSDQVGEFAKITRELVALGKELYPIVEAGRPKVSSNFKGISVLPRLYMDDANQVQFPSLYEMENWWLPGSYKYHVEFKNIYGMTVVSFSFSVQYQPGGQYQGKGKYLANVAIIPDQLLVRWGFDFDANVSLVGVTNYGSKEDLVAGATLQLDYTVKNVLNETHAAFRVFVAGDGTYKVLN